MTKLGEYAKMCMNCSLRFRCPIHMNTNLIKRYNLHEYFYGVGVDVNSFTCTDDVEKFICISKATTNHALALNDYQSFNVKFSNQFIKEMNGG